MGCRHCVPSLRTEGVAELMDEAYRLTHSQLQQRSSAA